MVDKIKYEKIISPIYEFISTQPTYDNTLLSYPIPCIYDKVLVDMFFTYRRELNSDGESVVEVDELLISNPYTKSIIARFETNYVSSVSDKTTTGLSYNQYLKLKEKYMRLYEENRPFSFESAITEERQEKMRLYLKTFNKIFDSQLKKVYCDIGEVFFKWAFLVANG